MYGIMVICYVCMVIDSFQMNKYGINGDNLKRLLDIDLWYEDKKSSHDQLIFQNQ